MKEKPGQSNRKSANIIIACRSKLIDLEYRNKKQSYKNYVSQFVNEKLHKVITTGTEIGTKMEKNEINDDNIFSFLKIQKTS